MEPDYQNEWQGISFSSFTKMNEHELADDKFYNNFYFTLFNKYNSFNELSETWKTQKYQIANWLNNFIEPHAKVLSVGCGLGYIEYSLINNFNKLSNIYVSDFATQSYKWLKKVMPENKFLHPDDIINSKQKFDLIYFSGVDYALTDSSIITMLSNYKDNLNNNGSCILISASFLHESSYIKEIQKKLINLIKSVIYKLYKKSKVKGQFWGWQRNRKEYQDLIQNSGFSSFKDGFIKNNKENIYYIIAFK
jgi:hypothetical protein